MVAGDVGDAARLVPELLASRTRCTAVSSERLEEM